MKLSMVKKYRKRHNYLRSILRKNPVLIIGLDLPFIIAASTSLKNVAAMAIEMFLIHIVTMMLAIITRRALPLWLRAIANVLVSTIMMMLAQLIIAALFKDISNSLGMYLYLMAVNGMTLIQANTIEKTAKPRHVFVTAVMNATGFALAAGVIGIIREYFGNGTLWGIIVPVPIKLSGLLIPFSGFILMAFALAIARFLNKKLAGAIILERMRKDSRYTKL